MHADLSVKPFSMDQCNDNDKNDAISTTAFMSFTWEIVNRSGHNGTVAVRNSDTCSATRPCTTNYNRKLVIPPFWLPSCPGRSDVHVTVVQHMGTESIFSSAPVVTKISLQLRIPGVKAVVAGISENVGFSNEVVLDASSSVDLARADADDVSMKFQWSCVKQGSTSCRANNKKPLILPQQGKKFTFIPSKLGLRQGGQYTFRALVLAPPLCVVPAPTTVCGSATLKCVEACLHLLHCLDYPRARGCSDTTAIAACKIVVGTRPLNKHGHGAITKTSGKDSVLLACDGSTEDIQGNFVLTSISTRTNTSSLNQIFTSLPKFCRHHCVQTAPKRTHRAQRGAWPRARAASCSGWGATPQCTPLVNCQGRPRVVVGDSYAEAR